MKKNNTRKILINSLGIISIFGLLICFYLYRQLQIALVPSMLELTAQVNLTGNLIVPILFIAAIYHLILFFYALQRYVDELGHVFFHSLYVAALVFSGINILTDLTILTDIGHEYLYWDISSYWPYLYLFNAFHLIVVLIGFFITKNAPQIQLNRIFQQIRNGDDVLFLSLHHIALLCAVLGVVGIVWMNFIEITERFQQLWHVAIIILALFPLGLMMFYWGIRNSKKPVHKWIDEKQFSDTAFGTLIMACVSVPIIGVFAILDALQVLNIPAYTWMILIVLIMLLSYSAAIVLKNKDLLSD